MKIVKINHFTFQIRLSLLKNLILEVSLLKELDKWANNKDYEILFKDKIINRIIEKSNDVSYVTALYDLINDFIKTKDNSFWKIFPRKNNHFEFDDHFKMECLIANHGHLLNGISLEIKSELYTYLKVETEKQINIFIDFLNLTWNNSKELLESKYWTLANEKKLELFKYASNSAKFIFYNTFPSSIKLNFTGNDNVEIDKIRRERENIVDFLNRNNVKFFIGKKVEFEETSSRQYLLPSTQIIEEISFSVQSNYLLIRDLVHVPSPRFINLDTSGCFVLDAFNCYLKDEQIKYYTLYLECQGSFPLISGFKIDNGEYTLIQDLYQFCHINSLYDKNAKTYSIIEKDGGFYLQSNEDFNNRSNDLIYYLHPNRRLIHSKYNKSKWNEKKVDLDKETRYLYVLTIDYNNNLCLISKDLFECIQINNKIPRNELIVKEYLEKKKHELTSSNRIFNISLKYYSEKIKPKYFNEIIKVTHRNKYNNEKSKSNKELLFLVENLFTINAIVTKIEQNHEFVLSRTKELSNDTFGYKAETALNMFFDKKCQYGKWKEDQDFSVHCEIIWNNSKSESFLPFDFQLKSNDSIFYIEVKATRKQKDAIIYLTVNELDKMMQNPSIYFIALMTFMEPGIEYKGLKVNSEFCLSFYKATNDTLDLINSSIDEWRDYYEENCIEFKVEHFDKLSIKDFYIETQPMVLDFPKLQYNDMDSLREFIHVHYFEDIIRKSSYFKTNNLSQLFDETLQIEKELQKEYNEISRCVEDFLSKGKI